MFSIKSVSMLAIIGVLSAIGFQASAENLDCKIGFNNQGIQDIGNQSVKITDQGLMQQVNLTIIPTMFPESLNDLSKLGETYTDDLGNKQDTYVNAKGSTLIIDRRVVKGGGTFATLIFNEGLGASRAIIKAICN